MEFSARKNKSKVYCCVYGCNSRACKHDTVRFYHFPRENENLVKLKNKLNKEEIIDRFSAWVKVLKMGKSVSSSMRVCSLHFTKEDFIPSSIIIIIYRVGHKIYDFLKVVSGIYQHFFF